MITLLKTEAPTRDIPDMTRKELDIKWREAKLTFDQALAQKTETDRIYIAAATQLNTLDRLVKKVEKRAARERRAADRFLLRTA